MSNVEENNQNTMWKESNQNVMCKKSNEDKCNLKK